jgi:hypothetical protein
MRGDQENFLSTTWRTWQQLGRPGFTAVSAPREAPKITEEAAASVRTSRRDPSR